MSTATVFEWDDGKAEANLVKHGVSFEAAVDVFTDRNRLEEADQRRDYGERRLHVIGVVDGLHLAVTWTPRGDAVRIISARRANRKERYRYGHRP